jgi:hypothetical protein
VPLIGSIAAGFADGTGFGDAVVLPVAAVVPVGAVEAAGAEVVCVAVVDVERAVCDVAGVFGFMSSGKSFGATAAQIHRTSSDASTATKILFSI